MSAARTVATLRSAHAKVRVPVPANFLCEIVFIEVLPLAASGSLVSDIINLDQERIPYHRPSATNNRVGILSKRKNAASISYPLIKASFFSAILHILLKPRAPQ